MKKNIIKLLVYYVIGFGLYYLVLYLTQSIILNIIGLARDEVDIFLDSPLINVLLFTALYAFTTLVVYAFDRTSVRELNEALSEMKERVKVNEEKVANNRSNIVHDNSNSGIGSV